MSTTARTEKLIIALAFLALSGVSFYLIKNWSDWEPCRHPMNKWLLLELGLTIMLAASFYVIKTTHVTHDLHAGAKILITTFLVPSLLVITILGFVWHSNNVDKCIKRESSRYIVIFFLMVDFLACLVLTIILASYFAQKYLNAQYIKLKETENRKRLLEKHTKALGKSVITSEDFENDDDDEAPLSDKEFRRLRMSRESGNEHNCCICFKVMNRDEAFIELPKCKHVFHADCGHKYLKKRGVCPKCKAYVRYQLDEDV